VEHDRAESRAAHPGVADPDHVGHALAEQVGRHRQVPVLGHAGRTDRSAVLEDEDVVRLDVKGRIVDRGVQLVDAVEDDGAPLVLEEPAGGGRHLEHRAVRTDVAAQDRQTSAGQERPLTLPDDVVVDDLRPLDRLPHRPARHRQGVEVEEVG
jgi:hypothetical protein